MAKTLAMLPVAIAVGACLAFALHDDLTWQWFSSPIWRIAFGICGAYSLWLLLLIRKYN